MRRSAHSVVVVGALLAGAARAELKDPRPIHSTPEGSVEEYRMRVMFVNISYRMRYVVDRERGAVRWALDPELDPGFLRDVATKKNVPQTVDRTRRWVDSGGTWRP